MKNRLSVSALWTARCSFIKFTSLQWKKSWQIQYNLIFTLQKRHTPGRPSYFDVHLELINKWLQKRKKRKPIIGNVHIQYIYFVCVWNDATWRHIWLSNGILMTMMSILIMLEIKIIGCCHLKITTFLFHSCCVDFCFTVWIYVSPNSTLKIQLNSNLLLMDTRIIANLLLLNFGNIFSWPLSTPSIH